nr:hypothetical protein GCM10020093_013620 [Planobispora longispora]
MSETTVDCTARRIAEHAAVHELAEVEVILHGGEPLLAGPDFISYAVRVIRTEVADVGTRVRVSIQTNGLRLDEAFLRLFEHLEIRVGVSLDGDEQAQDRHRRFFNGKGSHTAVSASLRRLASGPFHHLFSGLLCTIDIRNDPLATYEALLAFDPPAIDFLLPHGNWVTPPPFRDPDSSATPYADWLIPIFDRWYGSPSQETEIRFFTEIMRLLLGQDSRTETVGLSPVRMAVIETDGSIEQSDILKSSYPGAAATRMHILRDSFDAVLRHPAIVARQIGSVRSHRCAVAATSSPSAAGACTPIVTAPPGLPGTVGLLPRPPPAHHAHPRESTPRHQPSEGEPMKLIPRQVSDKTFTELAAGGEGPRRSKNCEPGSGSRP